MSSFNMLEMDMDIPGEVKEHSVIHQIEELGVDLTIIANVSSLHSILTVTCTDGGLGCPITQQGAGLGRRPT